MENTFGHNLSNVRINTNSSLPAKVGAIATTQGNRIDFAPGHYNPHTSLGQKLIGHEAWHTVQQKQGRVKPTLQMKTGHLVNDDAGLEREADVMGERVAQWNAGSLNFIGRNRDFYLRPIIQRSSNFLGKSSRKKHMDSLDTGADQIGLSLISDNLVKTPKSKAKLSLFSTVDISERKDQPMAIESFTNLEEQSWAVTKKYGKVKSARAKGSVKAKQTEVIGEMVAMNYMMSLASINWQLAMAVTPGHGTGVDQIWVSYKKGKPHTYMIVEAKGPKAILAPGQMSYSWVVSRIGQLARSSDPNKKIVGIEVEKALLGVGDGIKVPYVKGRTITARKDIISGGFAAHASKISSYN